MFRVSVRKRKNSAGGRGVRLIDDYTLIPLMMLMDEIMHHLGCITPCKHWDKLPINWCRISSSNSSFKPGGHVVVFMLWQVGNWANEKKKNMYPPGN